jgi:hypothetical protein
MADDIADPIVTRHLGLAGSTTGVTVEIGRPQAYPDGANYFCPYRILGLEDDHVRSAGGVDQIQALVLALQRIGAFLYTSAVYKAGQLYWLEPGNKDLGFPTPSGFEI